MNILCVGDIVAKPGREALVGLLPLLKEEYSLDGVIVNAENSAGGAGISERIAKHIFSVGCDVITLGDHVWDQKGIEEYLAAQSNMIRPANFPPGTPGNGWCIKELANGRKIGVINLLGRVFMRYNVDCPFRTASSIIEKMREVTPIIFVDMHAEATSEKIAMGHYLNGKVSAVFGTHTHVQTADEKILSNGTAYITDLGMTGPYDSVIGQTKENILQRFLTSMPIKFRCAQEDVQLHGIVVDVDELTGKATKIVRVQKPLVHIPAGFVGEEE
jgi:metallophosphoesterase (TIGR00282 family)